MFRESRSFQRLSGLVEGTVTLHPSVLCAKTIELVSKGICDSWSMQQIVSVSVESLVYS